MLCLHCILDLILDSMIVCLLIICVSVCIFVSLLCCFCLSLEYAETMMCDSGNKLDIIRYPCEYFLAIFLPHE